MLKQLTTIMLLLGPCLGLAAESATDADADSEKVAVTTYAPPQMVTPVPPKYPRYNQRKGQEGWVQLSYMVNPEGKPYDITVVASSNDERFEEAAVAVAETWGYQPATLDGVAIDAGTQVMVTFELSGGGVGAGRTFIKSYRSVVRYINDGDQEQALAALAALKEKKQNLYEEAYYQLARYRTASVWGEISEQYEALKRATAMDGDRGFLPDDLLTQMLLRSLQLQLKLNLLGEARLTTTKLLGRDLEEETRARIEATQRQIESIKKSGKPFLVSGSIGATNTTFYRLTNSTFSLLDVTGDVAELRLHCDKGYVGFAFDEELSYSVNREWDRCGLTVIGSPDTRFVIKDGG